MNIRSVFEMKHTEFLEMANNNTDGSRRRSSGNGMSFGPPPGTGPQRITLRLSGPLPPVSSRPFFSFIIIIVHEN